MPRMPAMLPIATSRRGPVAAFIVSMNGAKVAIVAVRLVATTDSNSGRSSGRSVSVP